MLTQKAMLFDNLENLSSPIEVIEPKYMEEIGQDFGYLLYRTEIKGPKDEMKLDIDVLHDRAQIWVDQEKRATWERWDKQAIRNHPIKIHPKSHESCQVDILVENMGRVNFGHKLRDRKGIHGVRFEYQHHFGWQMFPLTMTDLSPLAYKSCEDTAIEGPVFLKGILSIDTSPADTFIRLDGFTKGFVTVNGHNVGRYFNPAGPQKTLYIPAPFLKEGDNEIIVFESDLTQSPCVEFFDTTDIG